MAQKSGEDQKQGLQSDLVRFLAQNQVKTKKEKKKKGLHSDLVRFLDQTG